VILLLVTVKLLLVTVVVGGASGVKNEKINHSSIEEKAAGPAKKVALPRTLKPFVVVHIFFEYSHALVNIDYDFLRNAR
jgi:hypothetical protein